MGVMKFGDKFSSSAMSNQVAPGPENEPLLHSTCSEKYSQTAALSTPCQDGVSQSRDWRGWLIYAWLLLRALFLLAIIIIGLQIFLKDTVKDHQKNIDRRPNDLDTDPIPVVRPLPNCPRLTYIDVAWFEFDDLQEFEFKEDLPTHGVPPRRIGGKVSIMEASEDQTSQVKVVLAYGSSDSHMVKNIEIAKMGSALIINSAKLEEENQQFPNLCLTLNVFLLVKPHLEFENLKLNVANLDVEIQEGLAMNVSGRTSISTVGGNSVRCTESSTFVSRETVVDVHSGGVTGNWALFDLLSIHTQSGPISVSVQPKEAAEAKPLPAVFDASAQSGSVAVKFSTASNIPHRDYRVDVSSQSGSLSGSYIHGTRTTLKTKSGSLMADVYPLDGNTKDTFLVTESYSGPTTITILPSYLNPRKSISHMQSRHVSRSAGMTLNYPSQWQGVIEGSVTSGSIDIRGDGVNIIKDDGAGAGRHIVAEKGTGSSNIHFDTTSGSVGVRFD